MEVKYLIGLLLINIAISLSSCSSSNYAEWSDVCYQELKTDIQTLTNSQVKNCGISTYSSLVEHRINNFEVPLCVLDSVKRKIPFKHAIASAGVDVAECTVLLSTQKYGYVVIKSETDEAGRANFWVERCQDFLITHSERVSLYKCIADDGLAKLATSNRRE